MYTVCTLLTMVHRTWIPIPTLILFGLESDTSSRFTGHKVGFEHCMASVLIKASRMRLGTTEKVKKQVAPKAP